MAFDTLEAAPRLVSTLDSEAAQECARLLRLAEETKNASERQRLLELARAWLDLARALR